MDADQIIAAIQETPLSDKEAARIMGALLRKTLGEALVGAGMDLMLAGDDEDAEQGSKV